MIPAVALVALVLSTAYAAENQSFDSNGVKIHYVVEGQGEPVILVHGFTASIPVQWQLPGIFSKLSKDYQVIALDNRGHG
jgi:pimeloyl-ACP methyl ester carboxylesterase